MADAPQFSSLVVAGFETAFRPWMKRRLHGPLMAGLPPCLEAGVPLVLVANHPSWWDGFLLREVQRRLRPTAPLYTAMTARELRRHPPLRLMGAVGVGHEGIVRARPLVERLAAGAQRHPDAVVAWFPQGRIVPSFARPLGFRPGVELLARRLGQALILPLALHLEQLARPAPTAFILAGPAFRVRDGRMAVAALEATVDRLLDRLFDHLATFGEDAAAAWPPFGTGPHDPDKEETS